MSRSQHQQHQPVRLPFLPPAPVAAAQRTKEGQHSALRKLKERVQDLSKGQPAGPVPSQVAYNECRRVLDELIRTCPRISGSLQWVKKSYETCVDVTSDGWKGNAKAVHNAHRMATQRESERLFELRENQLNERIARVESENARLRSEIDQIWREMKSKKQQCRALGDLEEQRKQHHGMTGTDRQYLLKRSGLSMEQSADTNHLHKVLGELEKGIKELEEQNEKHYLPRERGRALEEELEKVEMTKKKPLLDEEVQANRRCVQMEVALQAAMEYDANAHLWQTCSVVDYVFQRLRTASGAMHSSRRSKDASGSDGDELSKHHLYLQSMDTLMNLIDEQRYFDAALLAACKCQLLLRVPKTMEAFQKAKPTKAVPDPMLLYCDTLTGMEGMPMNERESVCCAQYMISKQNLKNLELWLSMKKMAPSVSLGQLLYEYAASQTKLHVKSRALKLAETVFMRSGACLQGLLCMLKLGNVHSMLSTASCIVNITRSNLMDLLQAEPSVELGLLLMDESPSPCSPPLTAAEVLTSMVFGQSIDGALAVAKTLFGPGLEQLLSFMMRDNRTAKSEWMRLATECAKVAELEDLGLDVISGCLVKFTIEEVQEQQIRQTRSAGSRAAS